MCTFNSDCVVTVAYRHAVLFITCIKQNESSEVYVSFQTIQHLNQLGLTVSNTGIHRSKKLLLTCQKDTLQDTVTSSKRNRAKAFSVRQVKPSCSTLQTVSSSIGGLTQHQTAPKGNLAVLTSSLFGASMPTERYSWLLPFTQTPAGKPSPLNVTYSCTSQSQASNRDLSHTVTWCVDGVAKYSAAKGTKTTSIYLPKQLRSIPETALFQLRPDSQPYIHDQKQTKKKLALVFGHGYQVESHQIGFA